MSRVSKAEWTAIIFAGVYFTAQAIRGIGHWRGWW